MYRIVRTALIIGVLGAVLVPSARAATRNPNPGVLPVDGKAWGKTYGQWAAEYWKWVIAAPLATNPQLDETGEFQSEGQSGNVWFLAATFGSDTWVRECEVPVGKAIFFPIVPALFWAPEDAGTEPEVRAMANEAIDGVDMLECSVDGVPLENLFGYRAESPAFVLPIPEGSILTEWGYDPGDRFPAVADGYWILLAPLSSGEHVIHFSMQIGAGPWAGSGHDVTYLLTIVDED